jgi:hypothetical protein
MRIVTQYLAAAGLAVGIFMAAPAAAGQSITLHLTDQATWTQGCFDPCACPIMFTDAISGTMVLTPRTLGGTIDIYDVTDVQWQVAFPAGGGVRYTGGGTYTRFQQFASLQRLELDLQGAGDTIEHFDSGTVPVTAAFPAIDVTISIHEMFCFDTVIDVAAAGAAMKMPTASPAAARYCVTMRMMRLLWIGR